MTTVLNPPEVRIEDRFVLHDVSWETYEQLLKNYESRSVPRFTYDQGDLEIMSPSIPHEEAREALILLVNMICEARELDVRGIGSTNVTRFVNEAGTVKRLQWLRSVRKWIRSLENF